MEITPIKMEKDKINVTIKWLVTVKLRTNPIKLLNNIKVKITDIKENIFLLHLNYQKLIETLLRTRFPTKVANCWELKRNDDFPELDVEKLTETLTKIKQ